MNSSGPGAQRIKDAGVWFIQITIAKYLFNQNNGTAQLSGFGLCRWRWPQNVQKFSKIKMPEQSVPHPPHTRRTYTSTYTSTDTPTLSGATIKYQRAADGGWRLCGWRSPSFWGNAKLRYNGINLNKCRSQDFYAFLPHNKYFCCPQPPLL